MAILTALVLIVFHILLSLGALLSLIIVMATLSHRTLIMVRVLWGRRRVSGGDSLWKVLREDTKVWRDAFFFAPGDNNPLLSFYSDIYSQVGGLILDLCFLASPFVGWFLCVLTLYRLPMLVKQIWQAPDTLPDVTAEISNLVVAEGLLVLRDVVCFILFFLPLLVTVHRLPNLWRGLKELSYSDWDTSRPVEILYDEFRKIGRCKDIRAFSHLVEEVGGDDIPDTEMGTFENDEQEKEKEKEEEENDTEQITPEYHQVNFSAILLTPSHILILIVCYHNTGAANTA